MALRHVAPLLTLLTLLLACVACSSTASPTPATDGGSGGSDASVTAASDAGPGDSGSATDSAAGPDTWASYAAGFCKTYCTECHNPQDSTGRDFNLQAKVEAEKNAARCGVAVTQDPSWGCAASPVAKQFPIGSGPKPSDAERTRFAAWITAGAP